MFKYFNFYTLEASFYTENYTLNKTILFKHKLLFFVKKNYIRV